AAAPGPALALGAEAGRAGRSPAGPRPLGPAAAARRGGPDPLDRADRLAVSHRLRRGGRAACRRPGAGSVRPFGASSRGERAPAPDPRPALAGASADP